MSALARLVRPRLVAVIACQPQQQPAASFSSKDSDSFYKVVKSKIRLDGNLMPVLTTVSNLITGILSHYVRIQMRRTTTAARAVPTGNCSRRAATDSFCPARWDRPGRARRRRPRATATWTV